MNQTQQHPGRHGGAYHAGDVRSHGMHQQEIVRVAFQADFVGDPGRHRHSRNTGRADQRVDRRAAETVHDLGHDDATGGADRKRHGTQTQDTEGFHGQEGFGAEFGTNRQAQKDGDDIDQLVLRGLAEPVDHAAGIHQIPQTKHADQWRCRR